MQPDIVQSSTAMIITTDRKHAVWWVKHFRRSKPDDPPDVEQLDIDTDLPTEDHHSTVKNTTAKIIATKREHAARWVKHFRRPNSDDQPDPEQLDIDTDLPT